MDSVGRFMELSVPTADIQASLAFYHRLGFAELETGDIRTHHYAVVTDGRIAIGLHGGQIEAVGLTFVKPDLAAYARQLVAEGVELYFQRLGAEQFHELGFYSPDGHLLVLMEAPTFARAQLNDVQPPVLGSSTEISLGCRNLARSAAFWHGAGFIPDIDAEADKVEMLATGIKLGLRDDLREVEPALRFAPTDSSSVLQFLATHDIQVQPAPDGHRLTAPEGTVLLLADV